MKLGQFVITSALVLAVWLGFTFVHEVPSQRYPRLKKYTEAGPKAPAPALSQTSPAGAEAEIFHVSASP